MAKRGRKKKMELTDAANDVGAEPASKPTTAPKKRGKKSQYSDTEKAAFIEAVKNGRKAEASWSEILDAAKAQGFKSSLAYLKQLATSSGAVKRRNRGGRPKGSKNVLKAIKAKGVTPKLNGADLDAIEGIISKMVVEKLESKIRIAVGVLEDATTALRQL